MRTERPVPPRESFTVSHSVFSEEPAGLPIRGHYWIELRDAKTKKILETREADNLITLDYGVLVAMILGSGATPTPPAIRGLTMLGVGTGAPGAVFSPDAPDRRQRHLTAEIARKGFTSTVYRTAGGAVSSVPTNILDLSVTFGEGEAVGHLNEMGLMRTISTNPSVTHPVPSTYPTYDATIDLSTRDVMINIAHFATIPKTSGSELSFTWRLTI